MRRLDHRLRLERDQSIDAFEADPERLQSIAQALGFARGGAPDRSSNSKSGEKLLREYQKRREQIRACYERYFLPKPAKTG
jgi:hypothetical protein